MRVGSSDCATNSSDNYKIKLFKTRELWKKNIDSLYLDFAAAFVYVIKHNVYWLQAIAGNCNSNKFIDNNADTMKCNVRLILCPGLTVFSIKTILSQWTETETTNGFEKERKKQLKKQWTNNVMEMEENWRQKEIEIHHILPHFLVFFVLFILHCLSVDWHLEKRWKQKQTIKKYLKRSEEKIN